MLCVALSRAAGVHTRTSAGVRPGGCCAETRAARMGASDCVRSRASATATTCTTQRARRKLAKTPAQSSHAPAAHLVAQGSVGAQHQGATPLVVWAAAAGVSGCSCWQVHACCTASLTCGLLHAARTGWAPGRPASCRCRSPQTARRPCPAAAGALPAPTCSVSRQLAGLRPTLTSCSTQARLDGRGLCKAGGSQGGRDVRVQP